MTVAYRYLQTSTDVALTSGDPTVAAPGYLYSGGEQVKPTNPPATFEELQERMEALDELANMTEQESSYTLCTCSMHAHTLCVFTPIDLDWKPARELEGINKTTTTHTLAAATEVCFIDTGAVLRPTQNCTVFS